MKSNDAVNRAIRAMSLLSWERGLKYFARVVLMECSDVAPLVGAWIEIILKEIYRMSDMSLLSWERGLKYLIFEPNTMFYSVAPLVGAWIEILYYLNFGLADYRRSSRGSVD